MSIKDKTKELQHYIRAFPIHKSLPLSRTYDMIKDLDESHRLEGIVRQAIAETSAYDNADLFIEIVRQSIKANTRDRDDLLFIQVVYWYRAYVEIRYAPTLDAYWRKVLVIHL
ncbi:hypothetical protein Droror1_Dr00003899 [Drosera rotundifolia]